MQRDVSLIGKCSLRTVALVVLTKTAIHSYSVMHDDMMCREHTSRSTHKGMLKRNAMFLFVEELGQLVEKYPA